MAKFPSQLYPLASNVLAHAIPYALAPFHSLGSLHGHAKLWFLHLFDRKQKQESSKNDSDPFGVGASLLITNYCYVLGNIAQSRSRRVRKNGNIRLYCVLYLYCRSYLALYLYSNSDIRL